MARNLDQKKTDFSIKILELMLLRKRTLAIGGEDNVAYVIQLRIDFASECLAAVEREIQERAEAQVVKALQVFPVM